MSIDDKGTLYTWTYVDEVFKYVSKHKTMEGSSKYGSLCVSPNGRYAVTEHLRHARLWNVETDELLAQIEGYWDGLCISSFSISDEFVATLGKDGIVRLYKHGCNSSQLTENVNGGPIIFSPDGKQLMVQNGNYSLSIWNVANKTKTISVQSMWYVLFATWVPHSNFIVTMCVNGKGYVWDIETGENVAIIVEFSRTQTSVTSSHDGTYIAIAGCKNNMIWRTSDWKKERDLEQLEDSHSVSSLSFSSNDKMIAGSGSYRNPMIIIWDVETGLHLHTLRHDRWVSGVAFVPIDYRAVKRMRETMLAISIVMEQRDLQDNIFFPRELWSKCLKYVSWKDWV